MLHKQDLRRDSSLLLQNLRNKESKDKQIHDNLQKLNIKSETVLGYFPISSEPNIIPFLTHLYNSGHTIGLPIILNSNDIGFRIWTPNTKMIRRSKFSEPSEGNLIDCSKDGITVLTPLVACTSDGSRLGRGGGYYDRFFSRYPKIIRVGICYSVQILKQIPIEKHDQKLHYIVSEDMNYAPILC